jgi:hypothetical protein
MMKEGQSVRVPDPDGEGELRATFLAPAEPHEAIEVKGRRVDAAWVRFTSGEREGTTYLYRYAEIKALD